jgi:hypothetical protein
MDATIRKISGFLKDYKAHLDIEAHHQNTLKIDQQ